MSTVFIIDIACFLSTIFFSILFLQSGLDKLINRSANIAYFKESFSKTYFNNYIVLLFWIITLLECVTGIICFFSLFFLLSATTIPMAYNGISIGLILSNITIICLFMGQRIAKDYAGAASLSVYFLISLLGLFLLNFV
tara:strand:+ start:931 stop:1347 length:417 start_codon:yes stop_codon:yes gene_type:complete